MTDPGERILCFTGTTLNRLKQALRTFGREPHSVTGSSCLDSCVVDGVSNLRKGTDPLAFVHRLWALLDVRDAQCTAEHNGGYLDLAAPDPAQSHRDIDPRNQRKPGIGHTPRGRDWNDGKGVRP